MNLFVWGVNHKSAAVELRERLSFHRDELPQVYLDLLGLGFQEVMVLSTCNRTEIYACALNKDVSDLRSYVLASRKVSSEELDRCSRELESFDVVEHLLRVVASLDSMVIGEPEIVSQVKNAFQMARDHKGAGKILNNLTQKAFQVAKRIRTETELSSRPTSVGAVGANLALQIFGHQGARNILVMGAGEMAEVCLKNLLGQVGDAHITVCNRNIEKAQILAQPFGGEAKGLEDLEHVWCKADMAICSLGTQEPIITLALMQKVVACRNARPLFIIDLGLPRNVEHTVKKLEDVFLYDMDDLQRNADDNIKYRQSLIASCEPFIREGVADFETWLLSLENQVLISDVMRRNEELIELELDKSLKKLGDLNQEQMAELRYLLQRVVKKAMHHPIHSLRNGQIQKATLKQSWREFFFGS